MRDGNFKSQSSGYTMPVLMQRAYEGVVASRDSREILLHLMDYMDAFWQQPMRSECIVSLRKRETEDKARVTIAMEEAVKEFEETCRATLTEPEVEIQLMRKMAGDPKFEFLMEQFFRSKFVSMRFHHPDSAFATGQFPKFEAWNSIVAQRKEEQNRREWHAWSVILFLYGSFKPEAKEDTDWKKASFDALMIPFFDKFLKENTGIIEPTLPALQSSEFMQNAKYYLQRFHAYFDEWLSLSGINLSKTDSGMIPFTFYPETGILEIDGKTVAFKQGGRPRAVLTELTRDPADIGKTWSWDILFEKVEGPFGQKPVDKERKTMYEACRSINEAIAIKAKIDGFLQVEAASMAISPRFSYFPPDPERPSGKSVNDD